MRVVKGSLLFFPINANEPEGRKLIGRLLSDIVQQINDRDQYSFETRIVIKNPIKVTKIRV